MESYGIFSYTSPAREKMILCPSIKATCCPAYEQFKLFKNYNTIVKPYFKVFEQVINKSLVLLKDRVNKFFALNMPEQISKMKSKAGKLLIGDNFNKLNRQAQILDVLTKMQERLPTTLEYMDHLKSMFFCTICGYANQQFIDVFNKSISFSADSCDSLVRNTFQFSYLMNNLLLPFLLELSEFMVKAMKNKQHKVLKLKPLTLINKAIDECAKDYRDYDEGLNNCLSYCSFYKLNRNTPEFEGYPELFYNILVQMDVFIATGGTIKEKEAPAKAEPEKKKTEGDDKKKEDEKKKEEKKSEKKKKLRLLQELLGDNDFINIKYRILEESEEKAVKDAENKEKKDESKTPGMDFIDEFDPVVMMKKLQSGDIFNHEGVDPNYDDADAAHALEIEEELRKNQVGGLDSIIRKHYAENFAPEIDDIDSDDIFSRPVNEKVHLDQFKSKFGFNGIDFTHEMRKVDWNMNIRALVGSLQGKDETGPTNDHLDLKVMELANSVSNKSVIRFHRDLYLNFDGTHLHQPNSVIKGMSSFLHDKAKQEFTKTTRRAANLVENVAGTPAADQFRAAIKASEQKFAYKVNKAMTRINKRLENSDLTQLKEIEDKIANATIDQLIELQSDMLTMKEMCAGEKRQTLKCKVAYNRLANVFDLDPFDEGMETTAQELLNLSILYTSKDRKESVEELKKDQEALDKLEEECKEKLDTKVCKDKLLEYTKVFEVEITPEFFDKIQEKIDALIVKAEEAAKGKEEDVNDDAPPADAQPVA